MTNSKHVSFHTRENLKNNYDEIRERFIMQTQPNAKKMAQVRSWS